MAGSAHQRFPSCRLLLASGSSCVLARARPRRPAPPYLAASSSPGTSPAAPRHPLDPSHSLPCFFPSSSALCRATPERTRCRRSLPPRPPATPRLTDAPRNSATSSSTSSTSHEAPDVPQHRPPCLLQPRDRRPSSSNSSAPDRPRPRRASPRHRREPLTLSPNSACSPPCRSTVPHEHRSHRPPLPLHA